LITDKLPINALTGISKRRSALFGKIGIYTVFDLLRYFPRDYEDWESTSQLSELNENQTVTFVAEVIAKPSLRRKGKMSILKVALSDSRHFQITATWFNQPYYEDKLIPGNEYYFRGRLKKNGLLLEVLNPAFSEKESNEPIGIRPIYKLTSGLTQGVVRSMISQALQITRNHFEDSLPYGIRMEYKLCSEGYAYEKIHQPRTIVEYEMARTRLVFEELFYIQAGLRLLKNTLLTRSNSIPLTVKNETLVKFTGQLPFVLTDSQHHVIREVLQDMSQKTPMNRLIQGDVGSGKTVCCAVAMLCCVLSGCQAIMMAPTTILANQHYQTLTRYFMGFDIRISLLIGSLTQKKKKEMLEDIHSGKIHIVVGTQAILENKVSFSQVGLVITDEQHRFGVKQRSSLSSKSDLLPHVLVMSATPIPRTLSFVIYGELDISTIRELPKGRIPIKTYTASSLDDTRIYTFVDREIATGRQIYIVCPLIENSEQSDLHSAKVLFEELKQNIFPHRRVEILHGALKTVEKTNIMNAFYHQNIDVLISTTVVEVGLDNPNASVMLIQNAERFGLAQLHQLRGRIGRGPYQSVCILKSDTNSPIAKRRLKILCKTMDGFEIANQDLLLRGAGDFFGTRQHGIPEMKIANLYRDIDILKQAKEAVDRLFQDDPCLEMTENKSLLPMIKEQFGDLSKNIGL
jgi:ATP-dependent DNA helicase RecG